MEIMKIFSDVEGDEVLYSVLLNEDEIALFSEYIPGVTKYDRTDRIKQMKDSDVLAERKRSNARSYVSSAKSGVLGAAIGTGVGAVAGALTGKGVGKGAKLGGLLGGSLAGGGKLLATHGEREQNRFVNRRLGEAKRQAVRREAKDWKNNSVNREGYTY